MLIQKEAPVPFQNVGRPKISIEFVEREIRGFPVLAYPVFIGSNLVPRVLRLLGQRLGRPERLWGNGFFLACVAGGIISRVGRKPHTARRLARGKKAAHREKKYGGSPIDLFSLYVLLPHFRPRDGTLENHCFQILKYLRAYE